MNERLYYKPYEMVTIGGIQGSAKSTLLKGYFCRLYGKKVREINTKGIILKYTCWYEVVKI